MELFSNAHNGVAVALRNKLMAMQMVNSVGLTDVYQLQYALIEFSVTRDEMMSFLTSIST